MNKTVRYSVEFFTDWHCGSGLSSGADLDLLVIKDKDRLPFIPGKTVKGLVREAIDEIWKFEDKEYDFTEIFGKRADSDGSFFTNATLEENLRDVISGNKLQEHLYRSVASTAIDENGIAEEHSLRKMEITVPCTLEGEIRDVPDDFVEIMEKGLKFIKRLGQNRNRGLGRCQFQIIKDGGNQ
jgi:CRISPR/Cas system CSM-associated protein Csm3 (group 7 of RAMP superfamily)